MSDGAWTCGTPPPKPTGLCTGDAAIDQMLNDANIPHVIGLSTSSVYTWDGFCSAVQQVNNDVPGPALFLGSGQNQVDEGLVNVTGRVGEWR